jgi:hypothetical protein
VIRAKPSFKKKTRKKTSSNKSNAGILRSIKKSAPTVKRVVITSSFASIIDGGKGNSIPDKTYSEADWNPITEEEALKHPANG